MYEVVLFFLFAVVALYVLFGGVDLGAGILELFAGKRRRQMAGLVDQSLAPVWEANHVWLVVAVVILFVGFPGIFRGLFVAYHIPLTLALFGIVLRGFAFAYRYTDPESGEAARLQAWIFRVGSLMVPFFLGTVAGSLTSTLQNGCGGGFYEIYLAPWWNPRSLLGGVLAGLLFAWLAAFHLRGRTADAELRRLLERQARWCGFGIFLAAAVFLAATSSGPVPFALQVWDWFPALGVLLVSGIFLLGLAVVPGRVSPLAGRLLSGLAALLLLGGWALARYPVVAFDSAGEHLTFLAHAAPAVTLRMLALALLVGSLLIFPAFGWMLWLFRARNDR